MIEILWAWVEAFIRWLHVIAGIAWIGSSFFFMHLDYSLKQRATLPARASGDAWQVHGGGFYHMVKFLVTPATMPDELTWHKWEAYTTWLSGFALLALVYYLGAELYLIDRSVLDLTVAGAIAASAGSLVAAWLAYDLACRSPLGKQENLLALAILVALVALAWFATKVFSARGAFMQMGAIMGTIMVANVAMVIIPGQRKVIADLVAGREPAPVHGMRGKQRSTHNNYLTLATVFVMIAGHTPLAFATRFSWAILGLLIVIGALIRHFYNERHKGNPDPWWVWGATAALGLAVMWLSSLGPANVPPPRRADAAAASAPAAYKDVDDIVLSRCSMCHAREPVWLGVPRPPKGLMLETERQIRAHARDINLHAVLSSAMPPGNITDMTGEERARLALWLAGPRR